MSNLHLRPVGLLYCDFCGKTSQYVDQLIAGERGHHICCECVAVCEQIIKDTNAVKADVIAQTQSKG